MIVNAYGFENDGDNGLHGANTYWGVTTTPLSWFAPDTTHQFIEGVRYWSPTPSTPVPRPSQPPNSGPQVW